MKKFIEGPNGSVVRDVSYVGEDAWDDEPEPPQERMKQIISSDVTLKADAKKELFEGLGISGTNLAKRMEVPVCHKLSFSCWILSFLESAVFTAIKTSGLGISKRCIVHL